MSEKNSVRVSCFQLTVALVIPVSFLVGSTTLAFQIL
jgi:hypothetical protein